LGELLAPGLGGRVAKAEPNQPTPERRPMVKFRAAREERTKEPAPELDPPWVTSWGEGLAASAAARHGEREAEPSLSQAVGDVCRAGDTKRLAGGGVMDWRRSLTAQIPVGAQGASKIKFLSITWKCLSRE